MRSAALLPNWRWGRTDCTRWMETHDGANNRSGATVETLAETVAAVSGPDFSAAQPTAQEDLLA